MKRYSSQGQMIREQQTYWHDMKFDHTKHDIEQFAYDLKVLGKMIEMSDEQVYEYFKETFPAQIEAQLLEIEDIDVASGKARVLVLLFKS